MKRPVLIPFLLLFLTKAPTVSAQLILVNVPRENLCADSVAHRVYVQALGNDPANDPYGIGYSRKFGWFKMSEKINTDSFYNWTKQYCIERVGEDFFYRHFRFGYYSFKDNTQSEIYEIRYYFLPFDSAATQLDFDSTDYTEFIFKSFDFLGIHEVGTPPFLPDCRTDPAACRFAFDRAAVLKIAEEKGLKSQKGYPPRLEFQPDLSWKVWINVDDWTFYQYSVESRTGAVSETTTRRRID
jgi:hypothetical protein